jgi:hypothetical protein
MEIKKLREIYNNLPDINCPHTDTIVKFNAKGFGHLIYKNGARRRTESEIQKRVEYLTLAQQVLSITTTVQEKEAKENISMYGYIAIIDDLKLKVIIKKIGNGSWFFYSVIPHFVTSPKRD